MNCASRSKRPKGLGVARFFFVSVGLLAPAGTPVAAPAVSAQVADVSHRTTPLRRRLDELELRPESKHAASVIEHARRAVARASRAYVDANRAERKRRIAESALTLASRTMARRRTVNKLLATQRRTTMVREMVEAQERALYDLMRWRATLVRKAEHP